MNFKSLPIIKIIVYSLNIILFVFAFSGALLASEVSNAQISNSVRETIVDMKFENDNLLVVFEKISKETGFEFIYNKEDFNNEIKLNANYISQSLYNVLLDISKKAKVKFKQINGNINVQMSGENTTDENLVEVLESVEVTGKVTDENGDPLPGASIVEVGTSNGTITDVDGNYKIVVNEGATLKLSFVGYLSQEIQVGALSTIDVQMELDAMQLEELVVIGYGTQKKSDLTGAIASVDPTDVQALTTSNPTLALQGRAAGVNVQSNGGSPGAEVSVVIRGAASLTSVTPLYVVDGVFMESLSSVNSADIESIEILKDASAAAIYGSRAANGVVIVTTKNGSANTGIQATVHFKYGITEPTSKLGFMNARQYADARNAISDAQGIPRAPANDSEFDSSVDTDWQDKNLRTGTIQDYGFNISGGSDNFSAFFSANHFKETGVLISEDFERTNLRFNSQFRTNDSRIVISQNFGLASKSLNENQWYGREGFDLPTLPFTDANGNFVAPESVDHGVVFGVNSYANATVYDDEKKTNDMFGNISGEVTIIPGLKYKLNMGLTFTSDFDYLFIPRYKFSDTNPIFNEEAEGRLTEDRSTRTEWLVDNLLSYSKQFDKHSVDAMVGLTYQKSHQRGTIVSVSNFPSNNLRTVSAATASTQPIGHELNVGLASVFGRVMYNYDNRYLVTGTLRQDKSSKFLEEYRTGNFPSLSVGWNVSNESFFPDNDLLNNLKVRFSYGELGSSNVQPYSFSSVIASQSPYVFGGNLTTGFAQLEFNVRNLVWEVSKTTNFGLDIGMFNDKINLSVDYFDRRTNDILVSLPIPPTSGSALPVTTNSASIRNKGIELNLGYSKYDGDFKYDVNLNVTSLKNEVTSLGQLNSPIRGGIYSSLQLPSTYADEGQPLGVFWGYVTEGIYQSQSDIDNDPNLSNDPTTKGLLIPGDPIWKDTNGDGFVNDADKVDLGSPFPDFDFGLSFNSTYKNFEFNMFFQGQVGNEIFNARKFYTTFATRSNYSTDALNAWTPTNTDTNIPSQATSRVDASDFYVEDGTYLRLKQLQVAYNMKDLIKGFSNIKAYVNAQNLFTITGYSGYDPEVGVDDSPLGNRLLSRGVDNAVTPQTIQVLVGVVLSIR